MSIPLDQFYNFLDHSLDRDIIIYRWHPPGSKKLSELTPLRTYTQEQRQRSVIVVAHDQEPIDPSILRDPGSHAWIHQDFCRYWQVNIPAQAWPWQDHEILQSWIRPDVWDNCHDDIVLLHSEPGSPAVRQARQHGLIPVSIWSNALIARDWFRYAQHDPRLALHMPPQHTFLMYSRGWTGSREYRLWFLSEIQRRGLHQQNIMTFSSWDQDRHCRDHIFECQDWQCDTSSLAMGFDQRNVPSTASADYDATDYVNTMIEVVLETVIDRVHLTEKICRALACAQPFLLVAGTGSLAFLRHHGFQTFDGIICEDYDLEIDPRRRLEMILSEMQRIQDLSPSQKISLWQDLDRIAAENRQRFFSQRFTQQILTEFMREFRGACKEIGTQGHRAQQWHAMCQSHAPSLLSRNLGNDPSQPSPSS